MHHQRETTITNELVNILRHKRHGWDLEMEVNAFIKGNSELDALVIERGREPIGIEAKFATPTNAKNLIAQAETRLVLELETEYHVMDNGDYAIGSLELLDDIKLFDTAAEQIGGEDNTVVKFQQTFPHGDIDIVIQNPPFTRPGADSNTDVPKSTFQGYVNKH